jgi:hypothetical protein
MMTIKVNKQEIIDKLEGDIILHNKWKLENPKCMNNTFAQFISVGKISMLYTLGIIDLETECKYIDMAKGKFAKEILDMYNSKKHDEKLDDLIPLYDSLIEKEKEQK